MQIYTHVIKGINNKQFVKIFLSLSLSLRSSCCTFFKHIPFHCHALILGFEIHNIWRPVLYILYFSYLIYLIWHIYIYIFIHMYIYIRMYIYLIYFKVLYIHIHVYIYVHISYISSISVSFILLLVLTQLI